MSYQNDRDNFIVRASREGLDLATCRKLLRYATTLQRLQEAQCNGDWPYNGDRDRPSCSCAFIDHAHGDDCVKEKARFDRRFTTCPKCEASGVAKSALKYSSRTFLVGKLDQGKSAVVRVCPDCRTQELVRELLKRCQYDTGSAVILSGAFEPIFQGDPRGAVLKLATPNYPWSDDGRAGYGLYVPARSR